jgi:hypothetical protein
MAAEQVGLGVPDFIDECDLYKLQSHYFPIGKIGGKPAWLDPLNVPTTDDLKCEVGYFRCNVLFSLFRYVKNRWHLLCSFMRLGPKNPNTRFIVIYTFLCAETVNVLRCVFKP